MTKKIFWKYSNFMKIYEKNFLKLKINMTKKEKGFENTHKLHENSY